MKNRAELIQVSAAAVLVLAGCLPDDGRPEPGRIVLTIRADESLTAGLVTSDGWEIAYERFWLSLGEVRLLGDDHCRPYAEGDYLRVLDMRSAGPQTVNTSYALGRCELGFQLRAPSKDAVLGAGVDEDTRAFMREIGSDAVVQNAGVVLHVAGTAIRDETTLSFAWSFRQALDYLCEIVTFEGGERQTLGIGLLGGALFRAAGDGDGAAAELEFDVFAEADENEDGEISLAELAGVPHGAGGGTLAEALYRERVPELLRFEGRRCFVGELHEE